MVKMKMNPGKNESRREFLKSGMRTLLLGGIITVSGFLGWRKIHSTENGDICAYKLPCKDCSKYTDCTYPKTE